MTVETFRSILTDQMLPMLAGTDLGQTRSSSPRQALVAYEHPSALLMKFTREAEFRIQLARSQHFTAEEKELVSLFVGELAGIAAHVNTSYFPDLMTAIPRRVISNFLPGIRGRATLAQAIQDFEALASQTYEGHPVVVALGMTGSMGYDPVRLEELWREDFSRVLSNGFDSAYICGSDGRVFKVVYLPHTLRVGYAPYRLESIAEWSGRTNRVAIVLNRKGEVLVFQGKKLRFAQRRGAWRYYAHESVVQRLGVGNADLRRAVYESCLDVSFARTGGCVAVITRSGHSDLDKYLDIKDLIANGRIPRTRLLDSTVRTFQELDRRCRQELLSMDGATVLKHTGEVVAAGAIVRVPSGWQAEGEGPQLCN